jgi:adenosylcobinamide kinase/adenosylcobinamide-phosphate guanylyltransferase
MGKLILVLGGARSGKSTFAERLAAQRAGRVVYIATAQALDEEMALRVANHKSKRPAAWQTLELPTGVGQALLAHPPQADIIVLDCLTLLVSNLLLQASPDPDHPDETLAAAQVDAEIQSLLEAFQSSRATWIVVSNEVGMGLVPPYPLGRIYRDLLGRANQRLAERADTVYFMLAGLPMKLAP